MLIAALGAVLMVAKSKGKFDELVKVDVELVNIGDGLPERSDVRFHGLIVGSVRYVTPAQIGHPNIVHVELKPEHAAGIPNSVTARVIPSNVFAVSSIQFVDHGPGTGPLRTGSVVPEDPTLPTVLFQDVLAKLRALLKDLGRKPDDDSVGVVAALGEATNGRGRKLTDAGRQLNEIMAQLNTVVSADDAGPTTLSALTAASEGLRTASPELFNALDTAIRPMRTIAEKRTQLTDFLSAGLGTANVYGAAFEHQTDRLITIGTQLTPPLGAIADHAGELHGVFTRLQTLANKFYDEAWDPAKNQLVAKIVVGLTPSRTYVRADCPRYGELEGPSCHTAPEVPTAPALLPALASKGYPPTPGLSENRPNVTPPRHSMPDMPQGPPLPGPVPVSPPVDYSIPPPAESPAPPAGPAPDGIQPQSAEFGGTVGPVGSEQEKRQLSRIVGGPADAATELLLGPVARGMTVHIAPDVGGGP